MFGCPIDKSQFVEKTMLSPLIALPSLLETNNSI